MWNPKQAAGSAVRPVDHHKRGTRTGDAGYDRRSGENCPDVSSFAGLLTIRVQTLPEQ